MSWTTKNDIRFLASWSASGILPSGIKCWLLWPDNFFKCWPSPRRTSFWPPSMVYISIIIYLHIANFITDSCWPLWAASMYFDHNRHQPLVSYYLNDKFKKELNIIIWKYIIKPPNKKSFMSHNIILRYEFKCEITECYFYWTLSIHWTKVIPASIVFETCWQTSNFLCKGAFINDVTQIWPKIDPPPSPLCHIKMTVSLTTFYWVSHNSIPPSPYLRDVIYECSLTHVLS